ncbi:MAG: hypothetical protein ABEL76_05970 [Bradymonadaceae bacterium]
MTDSDAHSTPREESKAHTTRLVRGTGYVLFFGCGLAIFAFVVVGAVEGIQRDRVWNPYTGLPHRDVACLERARRLVMDAGRLDALRAPWEGRFRDWVTRCREAHGTLYDLLRATRDELRRAGPSGDRRERVPQGEAAARESVSDPPR